jgi:general secretion pathway protein K
MNNRRPRKQAGVALIVVLLALSLMVSLAAVIAENVFTQFKRATQREHYQQAYWYAIGAESLARVALEKSFSDSDTTNLSQAWAIDEQTYPLDFGRVTGRIYDRQACFNLNAFASSALNDSASERDFLVEVFVRLLESQQVDSYQAEVIADSLSEYLDSDNNVERNNGVEDSYYESMLPSYLPPNGQIAERSELRAVQQMSGSAMAAMSDLVCAIPTTDWRLNINTLSLQQAPLLTALFSPYLSIIDAQTLISSRPYDGWDDLNSFFLESQIAAIDGSTQDEVKAYLDVVSEYYELDALINVDMSQVRIRTLFYSPDRENTWVVRRQFGGMREQYSDRPDQ